jgi:GT2 family glycosyltransferase
VWRFQGNRDRGLLDERFGLGLFEDDDYCERVRQAEYHVACAEDVYIHHHHSATFGLLSKAEYDTLFARNREYYESKWGPWEPPGRR